MTWSSSKPEVAAVNLRAQTAKGLGTAVITVTTKDGGKSQSHRHCNRAPARGNGRRALMLNLVNEERKGRPQPLKLNLELMKWPGSRARI